MAIAPTGTPVFADDGLGGAAAATQAAPSYTPTSGNVLVCFVSCSSNSGTDGVSATVADNQGTGNVWRACADRAGVAINVNDATNHQRMMAFWTKVNGGGAMVATATFSGGAATTDKCIAVAEISGADGAPFCAGRGQSQLTPTTGTDAISSGFVSSNRSPALLYAIAMNVTNATIPTAGTGFTSQGTGWQALARLETKVTSAGAGTALAATYTGANVAHITVGLIFEQLGSVAAFPRIGVNPVMFGPGRRLPRMGTVLHQSVAPPGPIAGTDGATFGGTATLAGAGAMAATGGMVFGGTATSDPGAATANGGFVVSGTATLAGAGAMAATGGLTFGGTAVGAGAGALAATGGLTVGGSAGIDGIAVVWKPSPNNRFVQRSGVPFPICGRSAWAVLGLSASDYKDFLDNTAGHGYTAIEIGMIWRHPLTSTAPFANAGTLLPFNNRLDGGSWTGSITYGNINNEAPDFTTPNASYWAYVDTFIADCEARGIWVMAFPAYTGFLATGQGWMDEMAANGQTKMTTFGAFIANRYKNTTNILWMAGGDAGTGSSPYTGSNLSAEQGLITGLTSVGGQASAYYSAEWKRDSIATDEANFGSLMTIQSSYVSGNETNDQGQIAYAHSPTQPSFLLEEPYDEEGPDGTNVNSDATQPTRRFQWWGWLANIGGYMAGNGFVWPFGASDWRGHLNSATTLDMRRLNAFMKSIAWYKLVPSTLAGMRTLIVSGNGGLTTQSYIAAAQDPGGTVFVAYRPPAHSGTFNVDTRSMLGAFQAWWVDPTNGARTRIGWFTNQFSSQTFTAPGTNSAGDTDWVLLFEIPQVPPVGRNAFFTLGPGRFSGPRARTVFFDTTLIGPMSAAGGFSIGGTATLTAAGAMSGTDGITFGGSPTLKGAGAMAGTGGLSFTGSTANLTGAGVLAGTDGLVFGGTATTTSSGAMSATGGMSFGGTATAAGAGALLATGGLTVGGTGTAAASGALVASGGLVVGGTAAIGAAGALVASGGATFAGAAALTGAGALSGTGGIVFGGTGNTGGFISGAGGATFGGTATLTATGAMAASGAAVTVGGSAIIIGLAPISGIGALAISGTASLGGAGALAATAALTFGGTATLSSSSANIGGFAFAGTASLTGAGAMAGTGGTVFGGTAHATNASADIPPVPVARIGAGITRARFLNPGTDKTS